MIHLHVHSWGIYVQDGECAEYGGFDKVAFFVLCLCGTGLYSKVVRFQQRILAEAIKRVFQSVQRSDMWVSPKPC